MTWRSIGKAKVANAAAGLIDAIEAAEERSYDTELVDVLDVLFDHDFVVVRDQENRIAGIVTNADVARLYGQMATPFFLVGELDHLLRTVIATVFEIDEVTSLCDPDGEGRISSYDDMSFGDYVRVLQNTAHWGRLGWHLDRKTFIARLDEIRQLRNNIAHFNPDPVEPADVSTLRHFLEVVRELRDHVG